MSGSGLRETPLQHVHTALGATFTDFARWRMPLRYGSQVDEHHAVRRRAGVFDLSHMGEIEVVGRGAAAALDHALVSDMGTLAVGRARYTMLCEPSGGVLDDLVVYRRGPERFLVVANAANIATVLTELRERSRSFGAAVTDLTHHVALVAVQGPQAARVVGSLTAHPLEELRYYAGSDTTLAGRRVFLARTGYTGEDGFEAYIAVDDATHVWDSLLDAGSGHGIVPAGLGCRDTLRLEAGMPLYGQELSCAVTPFTAGLGRIVAFQKGDFVGREALLACGDSVPARRLVGVVARGRRAPRRGHTVIDPTTQRPCGEVTSGGPSPTLEKPIAMALVSADRSRAGTALTVDVRGRTEPVDIVPLPFYKRSTTRSP